MNLKTRTLLILYLFISPIIKGQKQTIATADTLLNSFTGKAPFDREFIFKLPLKKPIVVTNISVFEFRGAKRKGKIKKAAYEDHGLAYVNDTSKKSVFIKVPPLKPGRYCAIVVERKPFDEELDDLFLIGKKINENAPDIEKEYQKLNEGYKEQDQPFKTPSLEIITAFFRNDSIRVNYQNVKKEIEKEDLLIKEKKTEYKLLSNDNGFAELDKYFFYCEECSDSLSYEYQTVGINAQKIVQYLNTVRDCNETSYENLIKGLKTLLNTKNDPLTPIAKYSKRIENINYTLSQIDELTFAINYVKMRHSGTITNLDKLQIGLDALSTNLKNERTLIKGILEKIDVIKEAMKNDNTFAKGIAISDDTYNNDFITRTKVIITPDFGFVYYRNQNSPKDFNGLLPYFGFHINFKPIDSDIPWRVYPRKTILHYFSGFVGVSLITIAQEGERYDFLGNSPMVIGLGYRLGHAIRITAGSLLYYKDDANPLVSRKVFAGTPFVGLSIDLRIRDMISNVTQLLKF